MDNDLDLAYAKAIGACALFNNLLTNLEKATKKGGCR
jgi:hypothetical protein